jgi:subtilase family serine protease
MPTRPPRILLLLALLTVLPTVRPSDATTGSRTFIGLRGRDDAGLRALLAAQQDPASPEYGRWLTPQEFGERFGVTPRDLKRVERWLRAGGCRIRRTRGRQQVECVGTTPGAVPAALARLVDDVVDLGAPVELEHKLDVSTLQPNSVAPDGAFFFTPAEYAGFYGFADLHASGIDGAGERIGIVGTVPVDVADIAAFRSGFGLPPLQLEQVGTPGPNVQEIDSVEATLDVSWSGAVAPGAAIVLSISQGTVVDAIQYLVNRADVSVLSLSLNPIPNKRNRPIIRQSLKLFQQAAAQGQTVLIASGDSGPLVVTSPRPRRGVDPYAQSPFVTGVGGTMPSSPTPASAAAYGSEAVWQDGRSASGGGRSQLARPVWQKGLESRTRTVPDVSLAASAVYPIPNDGQIACCVAGTSAAAPSWAGLVAMLNQLSGQRAGLLNPKLYALGNAQTSGGTAVFHDIVDGSNSTTQAKGFPAKPGYDLATGWGSPDVPALFAALRE